MTGMAAGGGQNITWIEKALRELEEAATDKKREDIYKAFHDVLMSYWQD